MKITKVPPYEEKLINVIIETPRGSQNKFDYDPESGLFKLKKTLPIGMVFPFDFGFIPNTKGGDGDPLDVLVIMEQPTYPGCLVQCRLLGILEAEQVEKKGVAERNDRIVAVADCSILYEGIKHINELNKSMTRQIENFFIDYNRQEGKQFKPNGWKNGSNAMGVVKKNAL